MRNLSLRAPKALFSTTRIERRLDEVIVPKVETKRVEWIISRALCLYRCFDLTTVPARRRKAALELELRRWAPFAQYSHYTLWQGAHAQVWLWDEARYGLASDAAAGRDGVVVPETLLRGEPQDQGLQMVSCWDGVEVRLWRDGVLRACAFWPAVPHAHQWSQLVRGHGLPASTERPAVSEFNLRSAPWRGQRLRMPWRPEVIERRAMLAAATMIIAVLGWSCGALLRQWQQLDTLRERVSELNEAVGHVLAAKNDTLTAATRADELAPFVQSKDNLTEMYRLLKHLKPFNVSIREWHFNAGQVRVVLNAEAPPLRLVQVLQADPAFVELTPDAGARAGVIGLTWKVEETSP